MIPIAVQMIHDLNFQASSSELSENKRRNTRTNIIIVAIMKNTFFASRAMLMRRFLIPFSPPTHTSKNCCSHEFQFFMSLRALLEVLFPVSPFQTFIFPAHH
jgi:hypothetical protein